MFGRKHTLLESELADAELCADIRCVINFLAVSTASPTVSNTFDAVVLCGSAVLSTIDVALTFLERLPSASLTISGGVGHSTPLLYDAVAASRSALIAMSGKNHIDLTEAAIFAQIVESQGFPMYRVKLDERSTNCGQNAEESVKILLAFSPPVRSIVVIQDPTMSRRSLHSFEQHCTPHSIRVDCATTPVEDLRDLPHPRQRFLSLLLGEIPRLRDDAEGYGPLGKGFITHCDIPRDVLDAHARLSDRYHGLVGR